MSEDFNPEGLLDHWFKDCRTNPDSIPDRMGWWFGKDEARDRWMFDKYGEHCEQARAGVLDGLQEDPGTRLALILLLDQLPRNLYRGTGQAFASDAQALALCVEGHRLGMDLTLTPIERVFFWMPLQHVEDLDLQNLGVSLYDSLGSADPYRKALWTSVADYSRLHSDIIARFGRFPHRNAILGREPTPEETAYLEDGGHSFGQ